MFNKKKKVQKAFDTIANHIDGLYESLDYEQYNNLHGLLNNIKNRTGVK